MSFSGHIQTPKDTLPKRQKKHYRLHDLDVKTVGLVDTPAVEGSRFLISKRFAEDAMDTSEPLLLTPEEINYYRMRQKVEECHQATCEWLAGLSETHFVEELEKYDSETQDYWLRELEQFLLEREEA